MRFSKLFPAVALKISNFLPYWPDFLLHVGMGIQNFLKSFEIGDLGDADASSYLKIGLSMAQLKAHPLETHSFAFKVLLGSIPYTSLTSWSKAGTRELLPTISTELSASFFIPDCAKAYTQNSGQDIKIGINQMEEQSDYKQGKDFEGPYVLYIMESEYLKFVNEVKNVQTAWSILLQRTIPQKSITHKIYTWRHVWKDSDLSFLKSFSNLSFDLVLEN